jgi:hypothetical protein
MSVVGFGLELCCKNEFQGKPRPLRKPIVYNNVLENEAAF